MATGQIGKFQLFYRGTWDEAIFAKCMGIVGSRRMTNYGRRVVETIVPQLVMDGWTIVSGFMYGVDMTAHQAAVAAGGRTIAVLGWGINQELGVSDQELVDKIINLGGLVVSLWEKQIGANWTFPARNKVVAEICHELIVVEAAAKSGALLTAAMMRKLKKPVWAVPGPVTSSVSAGTNRLIAEGKAKMWVGGENSKFEIRNSKQFSNEPILQLIKDEGLDADEIARRLGQPVEQVGTQLSLLNLAGKVVEKEGKFYAVA